MSLSILDTVIIGVYMAGMLLVGAWTSRYIHSFVDYALAGRRLTTPLLIGTLVSTYYGLDVTFGSSETAFSEGISTFFIYSLPSYFFYVVLAFVFVPRLVRMKVKSLPETLIHFYGPRAGLPVMLATALYSLPILSVAGMGLIGHFFIGMDFVIAALIGASIAVAYTLLGGLLADAVTDSVQFSIMCVSLAFAACFAISEVGGLEALQSKMEPWRFNPLGTLSSVDMAVYIVISLVPLVEPALYQRIFAAKSSQSVTKALLASALIWMAFDWVVVYLGIVGHYMVIQGILPQSVNESEIILHVTTHLLPSGLLGLFIAGCIATAMSTVDSYALIAASTLIYDGLNAHRKKALTEKQLVLFTRIATFLTVALALALSYSFERIRDAWIFMATILVSSLLVPLLCGFFLKQPGKKSGIFSLWSGFIAAVVMFIVFETLGEYDADLATQVLAFPGYAMVFQREWSLFVSIPLSVIAFLFGYVGDMRESRNG